MVRGVESLYIPPQGKGNSKTKTVPGMGKGDMCNCQDPNCDCGGCDCGCGINRMNPPTRIIPTRRNR